MAPPIKFGQLQSSTSDSFEQLLIRRNLARHGRCLARVARDNQFSFALRDFVRTSRESGGKDVPDADNQSGQLFFAHTQNIPQFVETHVAGMFFALLLLKVIQVEDGLRLLWC